MADITETFLRDQLLTRRQRLESVMAAGRQNESFSQLLKEVDAALERLEEGTYGFCEACHETVEKDRLLADPLIRYCLDHLTAEQRRLLEQDLELASQLQRELLPSRNLRFGAWETAYLYQPLGMVSGDYCDLVVREDGSQDLFFALGDASGKGVAASMLMTQLHAIFRTLIASRLPVGAMVERAGRIFSESTLSSLFATLICGRAGLGGEIEICNAGHCPAFCLQDGRITKMESTGVPLGMFGSGSYSPQSLELAPGGVLFLYTDGLSEARSPKHEEYGEERLAEVLVKHRALPPQALIQACLEDLSAFRSGAPLMDDLTVLALRRVGQAG